MSVTHDEGVLGDLDSKPLICVYSGGFDPLHRNHLNHMLRLKQRWSVLVVVVEPDSFVEKKHPVLMPQEDRAAIIRALGCVDQVLLASDKTSTADILSSLRPFVYAIGHDHDPEEIPERMVCAEHGIHIQVMKEDKTPRSSTRMIQSVIERGSRERESNQSQCWKNPPVTVSIIIEDPRSPSSYLVGIRKGGIPDLPGGFVELNETLESAILREVWEELSWNIDTSRLKYFTSLNGHYHDGRAILSVYFTYRGEDEFVQYISKKFCSEEFNSARWITGNSSIGMYSDVDAQAIEIYNQKMRVKS